MVVSAPRLGKISNDGVRSVLQVIPMNEAVCVFVYGGMHLCVCAKVQICANLSITIVHGMNKCHPKLTRTCWYLGVPFQAALKRCCRLSRGCHGATPGT